MRAAVLSNNFTRIRLISASESERAFFLAIGYIPSSCLTLARRNTSAGLFVTPQPTAGLLDRERMEG
jgi:hypothetical protein